MAKLWKKRFRPGYMMSKMVMLNCGMLLLVVLIIALTGNYIYKNSMEEYSFANTMEIQSQVVKSLDLIFRSVADNTEVLGNHPDVQEYLKVDEQKEQAKRVEMETLVRRLLSQYSDTYHEYLNIVIVSEKGQYLSNDSYRIQKIPLSREEWYQDAIRADGKLTITSSPAGRNLKSWKNYSIDSYISVAKSVEDTVTHKPLGVILIDLDIKSIQNLVQDISLGKTGFGYIQNDRGKVLYSPKNEVVYRLNPQWVTEGEAGQFRCKIGREKYNVIYTRSSYTNLIAVGVYDWGKTIGGVVRVQIVSVVIAVITAICALIVSVVFSATITKPITRLSRLMKRAQDGDLLVHFDNCYKGEIGQLGDSFNSMVDKIAEQKKQVYKEQQDKREAELKILHEQVKPHFLYNTLDTIQWMAKTYKADDIVQIVLALSNFFRVSLSQGKEYITLEKELEINYLEIQKFRYEDLFEYEMDLDESIAKCEILKLSLQPLVENALYHGIKESDKEHGSIWIRIYPEGSQTIVLEVEDDGAGMDDRRLEELNGLFLNRERENDSEAFGTLIVNDRVKIACGEQYGLCLKKRPGGGCISVLKVKRME
ncbi:MAG: sensor histidine kinase [Eubacteriales bacterium]|nr:sensor histidine kinase [Eubacteriales bacterium]